MLPLLVMLAGSSAAPLTTISERTLRLAPEVTFELVARGRAGCFEWTSEHPDIAEVLSTSASPPHRPRSRFFAPPSTP